MICNNVEEITDEIISVTDTIGNTTDYHIDENTIYDNTLPRTIKIKCPSEDKCPDGTDIIISQRNPKFYNTQYICTKCGTIWI
jgi:hypothetical protein